MERRAAELGRSSFLCGELWQAAVQRHDSRRDSRMLEAEADL
jgi:hypothetical protein